MGSNSTFSVQSIAEHHTVVQINIFVLNVSLPSCEVLGYSHLMQDTSCWHVARRITCVVSDTNRGAPHHTAAGNPPVEAQLHLPWQGRRQAAGEGGGQRRCVCTSVLSMPLVWQGATRHVMDDSWFSACRGRLLPGRSGGRCESHYCKHSCTRLSRMNGWKGWAG